MKKHISLILSLLLIISVFPNAVIADVFEIQIWHEDFEAENVLSGYNLTMGEGSVTVENNQSFESKALKITSGTSLSKIEKVINSSWSLNTNENIVVSFDFLVADSSAMFYMLGMDDYAHEGESSQKHEYFCRMKYVDATGTYKLLRNPGSRETEADCYLADVTLNQKNNLTVVFVPRNSKYFAVRAIYLNGTKCADVAGWQMSGIPATTLSKLRFAAKASSGTSTAYIDNIKISHFNDKTLAYSGQSILNEVNPYNPISLEFDNHLKSAEEVTLLDINGTPIESDFKLNGKKIIITPKVCLDLNSSYKASATGVKNMFDASASAEVTVNTIKKSCQADGNEFKSYELEEIKILLDKDISEGDFSNVSFASNSGNAPIGELRTEHENGNIYLFIPITDNLKCGEVYTISLKAIAGFGDFEDVKFQIAEGINVSKPVFTGLGVGDTLATGTLTASVTTDSPIPTTALMLLYYKENKLIGVSCKTISTQNDNISTSIEITETSDCYIKVYVVESLANMRPVSKCVTIGR